MHVHTCEALTLTFVLRARVNVSMPLMLLDYLISRCVCMLVRLFVCLNTVWKKLHCKPPSATPNITKSISTDLEKNQSSSSLEINLPQCSFLCLERSYRDFSPARLSERDLTPIVLTSIPASWALIYGTAGAVRDGLLQGLSTDKRRKDDYMVITRRNLLIESSSVYSVSLRIEECNRLGPPLSLTNSSSIDMIHISMQRTQHENQHHYKLHIFFFYFIIM
jgi:hypothetical protein